MLLLVPLDPAINKPAALLGMPSISCCVREAVMFSAWLRESFAILLVNSRTS